MNLSEIIKSEYNILLYSDFFALCEKNSQKPLILEFILGIII